MKKILLTASVLISSTLFAQQNILLRELLSTKPVTLHTPVICDSINVKGEKYDTKSLLKTTFEPSTNTPFSTINTDSTAYFRFPKPSSGSQLQLFKFYLTAQRYGVVKLEVKSSTPFELYVDGDKLTDKSNYEDSTTNISPVTQSIKTEPRTFEVVIKTIASSAQKCESVLRINAKSTKAEDISPISVSTSAQRNLDIPDMWVGKRPRTVTISPNGKWGAIRYSNMLTDGSVTYSSEIVEIATGKVILRDDSNSKNWGWMPKSNKLYYAATGIYGRELRTIDPATGIEQTLTTSLPDGNFEWSPKENFLLFSKADNANEDAGNFKRLLSPEDRQSGWRSRSFLYLFDLKTNLYERLTYGKETTSLNDISGDEKYLLFSTHPDKVTERPFNEFNLYRLNLLNREVDTLIQHEKFASDARFSPDAKEVLIMGSGEAFNKIGLKIKEGQTSNTYDGQAFILNIETGKIEAISRDFNPSISSIHWNAFNGKIYFNCKDEDYGRIYVYEPKKRSYSLLPLKTDLVSSFDMASNSTQAIYAGQSVSASFKAYGVDLNSTKSTLLSDPSVERLKDIRLGKVEDWSFVAEDGTTIKGRFYLPPQFDPKKKYPVLVYYYGGTTPTDRSFEMNYPLNLYAAKGYVVYTINPSGAIGYGQEFSARHVNAWGIKTADEIIRGTQLFCRTHNFADSTRVGCMGASYGGFMTQFLQTKTKIFKAAISHAGISALASYWGEGFWGYTYSGGASANSYPWNNEKLYTEQSPLYRADKINTPLLLLHGTVDTNVPIGESIQMYTALKILGKEVEFIRIEGENHSVANYAKRLEFQKTILAWFEKHLQNNPTWWDELYKKSVLE